MCRLFLIASITSSLQPPLRGLLCACGGACTDGGAQDMTAAEWQTIFAEASALGISFILLAGGEPHGAQGMSLRRRLLSPNMVFPVFTNGTMMDEAYLKLFERHRNLIPVFSIEGGRRATDARRGEGRLPGRRGCDGPFPQTKNTLRRFYHRNQSKQQRRDTGLFCRRLAPEGCGLVFFVEYVPVSPALSA